MDDHGRGMWQGGAAILFFLTLCCFSIVGQSHDGSLPISPAGSESLDSAYAVIGAGYERLKPIFRDGCFDCHSDSTDFPWYHSLPIVGHWLEGHVEEAHEHLDMTNGFPFGGHARQADNLYSIKEELVDNAMPLWQYRLMHWGAAPNREEKDSIYAWVDRSLTLLAAHGQYPFNNPENVPEGAR